MPVDVSLDPLSARSPFALIVCESLASHGVGVSIMTALQPICLFFYMLNASREFRIFCQTGKPMSGAHVSLEPRRRLSTTLEAGLGGRAGNRLRASQRIQGCQPQV